MEVRIFALLVLLVGVPIFIGKVLDEALRELDR